MAWWDTPPGEERPVSSTTLRALLALDALYERVNAMTLPTTDHSPIAGGIGHDAGAVGSSSPSSSSRPDAAPTASGSPSALRDGKDCACVPSSANAPSAVTPHLFAGVAGFEQRNASGPTSTIPALTADRAQLERSH